MIIFLIFLFSPFNSSPYLTVTGSPQTSIILNWNTETLDSTIVAYGLTPNLEDTFRIPELSYYHHATLTGLLPGASYYYEVVPLKIKGRFHTFPQSCDSFSFCAFGDTRTDSAAHQSVIDRMSQYPFSFLLHSGDLVAYGDNTDDWRTFFNIEDTIIRYITFMPTIGNHESPYWPYDTLFLLPDSEDYYSFQYANCYFINLNTQIDLSGPQKVWLEEELIEANNNPEIDWIFVTLHRPPYSSGNHGSQLDVRSAWCPLFETYNVDIVFGGHDHDYERTVPINGVVYIVTGGGGAPLRDVDSSPWTAHSEKTYHFCYITIKGRKLWLKVIRPDGSICDTLFIDKTVAVKSRVSTNQGMLLLTPNPFSQQLTVIFGVLRPTHIRVLIYDRMGRLVQTLVDKKEDSGINRLIWEGKDELGHSIDSGIYFVVLEHDDRRIIKKVIKAN
ncbi:hypothetical protein DRP53_07745 [candidate division WOR-3 bacterium]|uniref:T9SS type A sorting domain-containing protein n=1 Tax=candidate division WOR-3 bacterium TaxID=2052148 RepID=A0A660SFL7_UNCW3|nr:MAG: hypothetical protein DRP53_07745 [candidate division WOR-3 bacterium]